MTAYALSSNPVDLMLAAVIAVAVFIGAVLRDRNR